MGLLRDWQMYNSGLPQSEQDYYRATGDARQDQNGVWHVGDAYYQSDFNPTRDWVNAQHSHQEEKYAYLHSQAACDKRRVRDANIDVGVVADRLAAEIELWMERQGIALPKYAAAAVQRYCEVHGQMFNDAQREKIREIISEATAIVQNHFREQQAQEHYERQTGRNYNDDHKHKPSRETQEEKAYGQKVDGFLARLRGRRYKEYK